MITVLATNAYKAAKKIKPRKDKYTPILNTILLSESEGRLSLTALDDAREPVTEYIPARIEQGFSTCIPAHAFIDWLRVTQIKPSQRAMGRGDSDQIIMTLDAMRQTLKITAGPTRAEFKCIDAQEWPAPINVQESI